jgi:predicted kinase
MLYGYSGAGKTFFARQLSEDLKSAHVQADRIRFELFEKPLYDRQEDNIVDQIMLYMCEEFLRAGVSVILDDNMSTAAKRKKIADFAKKSNASALTVWFQIDMDSAFNRVANRDRRRIDDKYARPYDYTSFEAEASKMQNPQPGEDYIVLSGKHAYQTQRNMIIKRLYDRGLLHASQTTAGVAKPELVNLIPNPMAGRVDPSRRNISIR